MGSMDDEESVGTQCGVAQERMTQGFGRCATMRAPLLEFWLFLAETPVCPKTCTVRHERCDRD